MLRTSTRLGALALALLVATGSLTGCDALGETFGGGKEVSGIVEAVDATSITVSATRYTVDTATTIEDFASFSAIVVGSDVEIKYEDLAGERHALTIGDKTAANDNGNGNTP